MPKLVQKCGYICNGSAAKYMRYIATREGVEKLHGRGPVTQPQKELIERLLKDYPDTKELFEYSDYCASPTFGNASELITMALDANVHTMEAGDGYLKYIATRPRVEKRGDHGLFSDTQDVSLQDMMAEVAEHHGPVWTVILSLRREDASALGYDSAENWRTLLLQHRTRLAQAMKIPVDDFRWCAAFHDEGYHPHVHMMVWSADEKHGYKEIYNRLDSGEYTIEHIMPQHLTPAWASELGDDAENIHGQWLHRLANLTLAASSYNIRYSNASFQDKKTMKDGYLQSGLKMTQQIAKADHWGLPELEQRSSMLVNQCIALWPNKDTTYVPPQKQYDEIALDDDASLTGRQLMKYRFRGIEHEATTWVDMYVQMLKELHNIDTAYLNYLAGADDSVDLASQFFRTGDGFEASALVVEGIYVNTGTSTQHKLNMLRRLFEHYDQDPSDLVFFLNEKKCNDEESSLRHKVRREYWSQVLPAIRTETGTFNYVSPTKNNYMSGSTSCPGVQLSCVANYDQARIEIYIDTGNAGRNQMIYDSLKSHRSQIEEDYGRPLKWYNQEGNRSCKLYDELLDVSVTNHDDWPAMIKFHVERGARLLKAVTPFLP